MPLTANANVFQGIRVLDLTRVMSGPFCTAMLADLGAEVIKIETPDSGDNARQFGPHIDSESAYFLLLNRGKESITINLKSPKGIEIVKKLAAKSDVVVENFRPGVADRLGIGYNALNEINPKLIYASISGFGNDSPLANQPALDIAIQAMSGLMSMTGERDGRPILAGESIADVASGMFAAWGIAAALFDRERNGQGRQLEIAMMDSVFSMMLTGLSRWLYVKSPPMRVGNRHPETYPVDSFETKTGNIVLAVPNDAAFASFANAVGMSELVNDIRFRSYADRNDNEHPLREIIATWAGGQTAENALSILSKASIPAAPVWSLQEAAESDHAKRRELVTDGIHAKMGSVPIVPQPVRFSGTKNSDKPVVPLLGEHTKDVLARLLELSDDQISKLSSEGAI